jgi:hypothetical protein
MSKNSIFALLTLTIALGLIALLAFTGETVHRLAKPAPTSPERVQARTVTGSLDHEMGPTLHRNGLLLTH